MKYGISRRMKKKRAIAGISGYIDTSKTLSLE